MLLFPLAALVGAALGGRRGDRLGRVGGVRLRGSALIWLAVILQIWLGTTGSMAWPLGGRSAVLVGTYLMVGAWLVLNAVGNTGLRLAFAVLGTGWALNAAAIVPNHGMPVSRSAMAASGMAPDLALGQGQLGKHVEATPSTALAWLGDVIPVPVLDSVISIGDVVMSVGIALAFLGPPRRRRPEPERPGEAPQGAGPSEPPRCRRTLATIRCQSSPEGSGASGRSSTASRSCASSLAQASQCCR